MSPAPAVSENKPPTFGSRGENSRAHSYVTFEDICEAFLPEREKKTEAPEGSYRRQVETLQVLQLFRTPCLLVSSNTTETIKMISKTKTPP